ncbi:F-box/WD repeat-containing protein 12 [Sigmodon hispidus]
MESHLPSVPMLKIFSYLDAFSLLQAAQVNKTWNEVADSDFLWRMLCLKRWHCCDIPLEVLGAQSWKEYFLRQTRQEHSMSRAKPEDFVYREMSGDFVIAGVEGKACYLSGSGLTRDGQGKSVVCVVTSMNRLTTWNIRESWGLRDGSTLNMEMLTGVMTWVSPEQPTCIIRLTTFPELHLAITVDIESTIKVWNCYDRDALATNTMFNICLSLRAVLTESGPIILAGDFSGNIHIFRIPDLYPISTVQAFEFSITQLHCSPQKKWVFLNQKYSHVFPKVFLMNSLLRPSEYSTPVFGFISVTLCLRAVWTPRREDRITLMYLSDPHRIPAFVTLDMKFLKPDLGCKMGWKVRLVASFMLPQDIQNTRWMGVSDKNMIVCSSGTALSVFTIPLPVLGSDLNSCPLTSGHPLKDSLRVIVTFIDGSFEVYVWEERSPVLRKCYLLQNMRHLGQQSPQSKTLCDNVSITRVVTKGMGRWAVSADRNSSCDYPGMKTNVAPAILRTRTLDKKKLFLELYQPISRNTQGRAQGWLDYWVGYQKKAKGELSDDT